MVEGVVNLSDESEGDGNGPLVGSIEAERVRAIDPRLALELEAERDSIITRLENVNEELQALFEEQDLLIKRQEEIDARLQSASTPQPSGGGRGAPAAAASRQADSADKWAIPFEWDAQVDDLRKNVFGLHSFRKHQREIINAVLNKRDVFVIMPAGGGKSLCYQLPAVLLPGVVLVVSPLLSLIQDQMLTSDTPKDDEKAIYHALETGGTAGGAGGGGDRLSLLYVTPERVAKSKRFMSKLEKCAHGGHLALIAIDEAHCCSQWGHDFRPDYGQLAVLKRQFASVPMLALTATATERVQADVKDMLHMRRCQLFVSSVNRANLFYEGAAKDAIDDIATFIATMYAHGESGIVYCFTRRECEQVAADLRERGIAAEHYHADMEPSRRASVHTRWSRNKVQVIVGTVAFGMGINKPDVRFVIHHTMGKSIETYYQESGRAGRDGLPAMCLLYFRCADLPRQSSMVFAEMAGLHNLYAMARYCLGRVECRREAISAHFGEPPHACSAHACAVVTLVQQAEAKDQKVTMLKVADQWRAFARQSDRQLADELSKDQVERLVIQLILSAALKEEFAHTAYSTNAYVASGPNAARVLKGTQKVMMQVEHGDGTGGKRQSTPRGKAPGDPATAPSAGPPGGTLTGSMECMLDSWRQQTASDHGGIFPHAVLSSQHIAALCAGRPTTLAVVGEILGGKKAELYGQRLLELLLTFYAGDLDGKHGGGPRSPPAGAVSAPKTGKRKAPPSGSGCGDGDEGSAVVTPPSRKLPPRSAAAAARNAVAGDRGGGNCCGEGSENGETAKGKKPGEKRASRQVAARQASGKVPPGTDSEGAGR
eukprot:jgi/Mesen1/6501/ME000332S05502